MKAIVVRPGERDSVHMRDMPEPPLGPGDVAVKVVRVGLCATDAEVNSGQFGEAPPGSELLILGHENFGIVADVGKEVRGLAPGDRVVATVRRPCGACESCASGDVDLCTSGRFEERGIIRRHGYMTEYYVESPAWLHKIPPALADVAVLLEPTSVVEKAIDHAYLLQRRLTWHPRAAAVFGAGPIGLLGAALLRLRGLDVHLIALEAETDPRAQLAVHIGASYHTVRHKTLVDVAGALPPIDLALEATGSARVAFGAMQMLAANGVLCLLSLTGGSATEEQPLEKINRELVTGNRVVFGSVNAHARHFTMGLRDLAAIHEQWPHFLDRLITHRLRWDAYRTWFDQRGLGIKTTLEIG